jgi:hypothetical protein
MGGKFFVWQNIRSYQIHLVVYTCRIEHRGKTSAHAKTVPSPIPRQCALIAFVIDRDQNGFCVKLMEDLHARVLCAPHPQEPIQNHNVHKYF